MKTLYNGLISAAMKRYRVPDWIAPYIYRYAKQSDLFTIRRAINFINVRRKKGVLTGRQVRLPNGVTFDIKTVSHILNQFYYGVDAEARISEGWSAEYTDYDHANFTKHYKELAELRRKHARALKNMIEGLGHKIDGPSKGVERVFNTIAELDEWPDRLIATEIILRDSYARPFGFIFYKVFYPVSPEFMRSLGKLFAKKDDGYSWAESEIRRVVGEGALTSEHIIGLAERILAEIYRSIESEMPLARRSKVEAETMLLRDVSVAYPLHTLKELGVELDIDAEMRKIARIGKKGGRRGGRPEQTRNKAQRKMI